MASWRCSRRATGCARRSARYSHSIRLIKGQRDGQPGCPKINSGFVDARDVADLHVRAMTHAAAHGERFLAIAGERLWLADVARVLPNWFVWLGALKDPALRGAVPPPGLNMNASGEKARRMLGWAPRPAEEAIVATADSLLRLGLLEVSRR